jgi:uncharacterized protein YjbJ (UPF0337 family)
MNWEIINGNWTLLKGTVKLHFGKLTHNQLRVIDGKQDQLIGSIHKSYGATKQMIDKHIKKFVGPRQTNHHRN